MKITCQSCESKYNVSDEKVQGKTVKIKCRKCGATILVSSTGVTMAGASAAEPAAHAAAGGGGEEATYSVNIAEGDQRTMTLAEIVAAYNQSLVTGETYVWADGMADWAALASVEAIVLALNAAAPAAEAPRAAVRASERRDLFAAAPAPAPEPELPAGGLFSAASASSAASFGASAAAAGGGGDASTLFSLSALTARSATPSSPGGAGKTTATKDDSGLIDLRALSERAATAGATAPAMSPMLDDGPGLFPLGVPPSPADAPVLVAPTAEPPKPNKTPMFIGIGVAVAGLAIAGAFVAMRKPPPPEPPPAVATTAEAAPSAVASAAPSAEASAAATAAEPGGSPSAAASALAAKGGKGGPIGGKGGKAAPGGKGAAAAAAAPAAAAPAAAAPAPVKSKCNCPPGDLMCNIKCSAGK